MKRLAQISSLLSRYISFIIIICSVIAFFRNDTFLWTTKYTSAFLGTAMFGMGLTIRAEDFRVVFTRPKEVIAGCILQYTLMPLIAWLLAMAFHLNTDIALGVILVGCCPGGTASNVITYMGGGDVPLSVGMTICSTLLAPLATPALVYWLAGAWVQVSFVAMMMNVVKIVLIPVLIGIMIKSFFGKYVDGLAPVLPIVSVVAIVMIIAGIVAANSQKILTCGVMVLGVVALHNFFGMILGLGAAKVLKVNYAKETAIAIEVGMQNSGLAVSLAAANFAMNPLATLPGAIFSVWHNIAGSIFAGLRLKYAPRKED